MIPVLNILSEITMSTLNRHASRKRKYVRGNQIPFLKKDFAKVMMERTRIRNKFLQSKTDWDKKLYAKQQNYCVSPLRKSRKSYMKN